MTRIFKPRIGIVFRGLCGQMAYKKTAKGEYDDFAVYPLEGVWQKIENCELIKEKLRYTLMIRQPDLSERTACALRWNVQNTENQTRSWKKSASAPCRAKPVCSFCMSARMTMSRFLSQNGQICTRPQPDAHGGRSPGNLPKQCHPHRKKQAQNHFAL